MFDNLAEWVEADEEASATAAPLDDVSLDDDDWLPPEACGRLVEVDRAAQLDSLEPGWWLAGLLDRMDPRVLSGDALVAYLAACERQTAWSQSRQLVAIAELAARRPATGSCERPGPDDRASRPSVSEFAADEVAAELRISRRAAQDRIDLALSLGRLPGTAAAFALGRLDLAKVRAVESATRELDDEGAARVEARVLGRASDQVLGGLRDSLARAVIATDPSAALARHERKVRERKVELVPEADGMAAIWAVLRADDAVAVFEGLTALAQKAKSPGDCRTIDQRRADVLAELGSALLANDDLPRRHGRRPHLQVTVAASTLLGLDELPGALAGYGPIPAPVAREIAADATWRRLLTDPESGTLLDYGTTVYRPPQALVDKVNAKHQRCRGPGSRLPAARCQLDHTREFPDGPTAEHNLGPLSQHTHRLKHETDWTCVQEPDATYRWTSPAGRTYRYPLDPLLGDPRIESSGDVGMDPDEDVPPF